MQRTQRTISDISFMPISSNHFSGKVALKGIIEAKNKVLLIRDAREAGEIWEIPGGRMDIGESPEAGLNREIQEELGVACDVHEVVYAEQFWQISESAYALMIAFRLTLQNPDAPLVLAPDEILEAQWFSESELSTIKLFKEYENALFRYFAIR